MSLEDLLKDITDDAPTWVDGAYLKRLLQALIHDRTRADDATLAETPTDNGRVLRVVDPNETGAAPAGSGLPAYPGADGRYWLRLVKTLGVPTLSWEELQEVVVLANGALATEQDAGDEPVEI
ncbi:MAG: hypothetical protein QOE70_4388 [Chthoniobacter sp.]|jgi:hypothetical protein|nr:hypothetical protein [Chthoniobacter sp.]